MDADLVLTFLVIMQVSWLPVGTAGPAPQRHIPATHH